MLLKDKVARLFFGTSALGVAVACGAACGSRSEMQGAAASSGAGGSQATSTGAGPTSTSSGGPQGRCAALAISGDPITYEATPAEHGGRPTLITTADDGSRVSVVYYRQGVKEPVNGFSKITSATLSPWGSWPTTLGAGAQAAAIGGDTFAASAAGPNDQPGFSILFYLPTNAFPSDMFLAPVVTPGKDYDWAPLGVQWDSWEPAWPVALERGASGHLAAYQLGVGTSTYMSVALIDEGSQSVSVIDEIACAKDPFTVDVAPTTGGFLVATAAGRPFGACPLDDGIPGPAQDIHVIKVDAASELPSLSASVDVSDLLAHIALAKRPSGAWLVYHGAGANAEFPPPIMGALLDEDGALISPVQALSQEGAGSLAFAAAALGEKLLLAWLAVSDEGNPTIWLDLFDEAGAPLSHTPLVVPGAFIYDPHLSLLVSPDGAQALVAWSDIGASAGSAASVRVARLSCAAE